MKKIVAFLLVGLGAFACTQADPDQYKMISQNPVYGETNGVAYDATNDYLSFFINDNEVMYIDSSGNVTADGTITEGAQSVADNLYTTYGTGSDAIIGYETTYQAPDSLVIGVGEDSRQVIIGQKADLIAGDMSSAQQTNPTLKVCSANGNATECIAFTHDQTNSVIDSQSGSIVLNDNTIIGTGGAGVDYQLSFNGETNDVAIVCMEDENRLDVEANLEFGAGAAGVDYTLTVNGETNDFSAVWMEDEDYFRFDDDVVLNGGANSLQFLDGDETIKIADNDATSFSIGLNEAAGAFLLFDTTNSNEELNVVGTTATSAFRVDTGFATFDEQAVFTTGASVNGAGSALVFPDGDERLSIKDNDADSFGIGLNEAAGALMLFDTTNSNEEVNIVGTTATSAFRVDTGFATFDEQMVCTAGADMNDDILAGGGAGALTFDAASSSIVFTDNAAAGLDMGAAGVTSMLRFDSQTGVERIVVGDDIGFFTTNGSITGVVSLDSSDCGRWKLVTEAADGDTITLPATVAGCELKFMYTGGDGNALVDISPNAADAIHGTCTTSGADTEFSGADNADIGLTKGTANTGDTISLIGDGAEGWYVTNCHGTWANN